MKENHQSQKTTSYWLTKVKQRWAWFVSGCVTPGQAKCDDNNCERIHAEEDVFSQNEKEDSQFDCLPDEIIVYIFSFLPSSDLTCSLANMSKRLKRLVQTRSLWINKHIDISQISYVHEGTKILAVKITQYGMEQKSLQQHEDMINKLSLTCPMLTRLTLHHPLYTLTYTPVAAESNSSIWTEADVHLDIVSYFFHTLKDTEIQVKAHSLLKQYLHASTTSLTICPIMTWAHDSRLMFPLPLLFKLRDVCPKLTRFNVHNCQMYINDNEDDVEIHKLTGVLTEDVWIDGYGQVCKVYAVYDPHSDNLTLDDGNVSKRPFDITSLWLN
jgi:hypothetical protein